MKIREKLLNLLIDHGLFEEDASTIIDTYANSEMGAPMRNRLDDSVDGYTEQVMTATWLAIKITALDWIDANCPQHWARPLFG